MEAAVQFQVAGQCREAALVPQQSPQVQAHGASLRLSHWVPHRQRRPSPQKHQPQILRRLDPAPKPPLLGWRLVAARRVLHAPRQRAAEGLQREAGVEGVAAWAATTRVPEGQVTVLTLRRLWGAVEWPWRPPVNCRSYPFERVRQGTTYRSGNFQSMLEVSLPQRKPSYCSAENVRVIEKLLGVDRRAATMPKGERPEAG
jgi:hypothetical protein